MFVLVSAALSRLVSSLAEFRPSTVLHVTAPLSVYTRFLFDLLCPRGDEVKETSAPLNKLGKGGAPGGEDTVTV